MPDEKSQGPANEFVDEQTSFAPRFGSVLTALVAMLAVYIFRVAHSASVLQLILETVFFAALPLIVLFFVRRRVNVNAQRAMSKKTLYRFHAGLPSR